MRLDELNLRQKVGNVLFTLLILVIMIDPPNTVLHMKDLVFVVVVGYNIAFFKPNWHYLPHIFIVVGCMMLSYVLSEMQMNAMDYDVMFGVLKSVAPLILLLWVGHYDLIKLAILPTLIACLIQLALFVMAIGNDTFQYAAFLFLKAHNFPLMMTHRAYFGVTLFMVYYKSQTSFMFATFLCYYWLFKKDTSRGKRFLLLIAVTILTASFCISGTRSTMLVPFVLMGVAFYCRIKRTRYARYAFYPLLGVLVACFLLVVFLLASDTGETSNMQKYAHLPSYVTHFANHPEYLFIGQGAGTTFYSLGTQCMVTESEWTYIEVFRRYGLLCLPILCVIFGPLKQLILNREDDVAFGILWVYIAYLFVAGTNPLLFSSTGMIMVLMAYCFVEKLKIKNNKQ